MKNVHVILNKTIARRTLLKGAGVSMALPFLGAMSPVFGADKSKNKQPKRFVGICNNIGLLSENFFPEEEGENYKATPYLEHLQKHRDKFTVFSGVSHPSVDGGHPADNVFLTAAPHPGSAGFRNSISLDQLMAENIGHLTRFPSLALGVNVSKGRHSLSWTRSGVLIPCEDQAFNVYKKLFIQGSKKEIEQQVHRLSLGQSIMDSVADQAKGLIKSLGKSDGERMDQYMTSVRELEKQMQNSSVWATKPKPTVPSGTEKPPVRLESHDYMKQLGFMYSMSHLAFQTDSTRAVTLMLDSVVSPAIHLKDMKITESYHNLSHHGKNEKKLTQLKSIDETHMKLLSKFLTSLRSIQEEEGTLLDNTMVVYGSNLGNANAHVCTNLPIIFAGGPFKHGKHLAFDQKHNYPLPNLFVSVLQGMGMESDQFASSTGTMRGLERG